MFCKNCGKEVPENTAFCPSCGKSLTDTLETPDAKPAAETQNIQENEQTAQPEQPEQPVSNNPEPQAEAGAPDAAPVSSQTSGNSSKILKIAVPVLAVVAVLLIAAAFLRGGSSKGGSFYPVMDSKTGIMASGNYLFNLKGDAEEVDRYIDSSTLSADMSTIVYETDDGLFYAKHDLKSVQITDENVDGYYVSTDGSVVAYQLDDSIFLFRVGKDDDGKEVATEVYGSSWCISPDGKSVLYQKETSKGYGLYLAGWSQDEEKIAGEATPLAVSDGGKYKFYSQDKDEERRLYLASGNKEGEKIDTLGGYGIYGIYFNKSVTEVVYTNTKGNTCYFNVKKSEPFKMAGKSNEGFITGNTVSLGRYGTVLLEDSFKGQILYAGGTLYWVNSKFEGVKIASNFDEVQLAADGKSLLYTTEKGKLMKVEKFSDNMKETELYDGDRVMYIHASADLSKIYFTTDEDELYYYVSAKKQEKIQTDIDYDTHMVFNDADGKLYLPIDGEVYSVGKSKSSLKKDKEVTSFRDGIYGGYMSGFKGIIYEDEDRSSYYKESGKWKLILSDD